MKTILLLLVALSISGCSTPFSEYDNPNGPTIVERSVVPVATPAPVIAPVVVKKDEEEEVKTFPIDLDRN